MNDAYTTTLERLRENRTGHTSNAVDRLTTAAKNDAAASGTFSAGTRVLDLVSGVEGVTLYRVTALSVRPDRVGVRLDNGEVVDREHKDLLARPTPPPAA